MDLIKEMADAFIILIRVGAAFRVAFCLIKMGGNEQETEVYKKKGRNIVVFYIIAESVWQIKDIVLGYYG
ncbi:MAG: mercury transporter [Clostridia bacterium]|nr:mercury transporter [Clostridia bacterium]